jgi:hypothetical protein
LCGIAAIVLAFCPGWSAAAAQQVMQHQVRPAVVQGKVALVSQMPADQQLNLSIVLPLRNQAALSSLLGRLYDPASPDFHKFLSVEQFTDQFGPSADDYAQVVAFATANGLTVTGSPVNRLIVPVSGSVAQINQAFNVQMNFYQHPTENRTFYSPDREPSLNLSVPVAHVAGLDNYSLPKALAKHLPNGVQPQTVTGSGPGGSYLGSDMRAAYYGGSTLTGLGQSVGLLEFDGYLLSDVNLTFSNAGQSYSVPINNVLLDGTTGAPVYGSDGEQTLDIVQAIGMAPGLSQVRVYIGDSDVDILNSMASENIAKQLSCSWTWQPADPTTDDVFFLEMAAQGQSFFVASGDLGAYDAAISPYFYPADDSNITAVGGTHLTTTGAAGSWASEVAWNSVPYGSGGGISPDNTAIPTWQSGLADSANGGSSTLRNVPDVAMEGDFDNYNCELGSCAETWGGTSFGAPRWAGFMALVNQQAVEANNAPNGGIGFINPPLYLLAEGSHYSSDLHDIVSGNNETDNQPVYFNAVTGYDLVTGWGSPAGQALIDSLAGPAVPGFFLSPSQSSVALNPGGTASVNLTITDVGGFAGSVNFAVTSTLPSGVTAAFSPNPSTGVTALTLTAASNAATATATVTVTGTSGSVTGSTTFTLNVHPPSFGLGASPNPLGINQGASGSATVSVIPQYGFTGSVSLAVAGLPSGVTAVFSPTSTTGTSTLTFTVSNAAAAGSSPITITGTSGSLSATTTLSLSVEAPSFSLTDYGSISLGQGSTGSVSIGINALYGFNGSVNFAASGLPSGVTASFSPNPATGYATMTLVAASSAPVGQSTVTVTGTSGSLTATTTVPVSVYAPSFTLNSYGAVNLGQGTSETSYVYISPQYGFTGSVSLSVTGLPSGVTALFSPNPTTGSSTLSLAASNSAAIGQHTLTITGISGTLSATTTLTLNIYAPTFAVSTYSAVNLGQGTSNTASVYVTPEYGFSGNVNLSISGLPSGVTGTFSPNPTTGYSNLTLQASSTAAVGQYTATITGTSGSQTATTTLSIGVFAPGFTLYNSGGIAVGQGTTSSGNVYVNSQYGFSGNVTFTVAGLPSGVTAVFSPNPSNSYSTLTLSASGTAVVGTYNLTITGTSGTQTATTSVSLGVYTPTFTLSDYGSVTIGQGSSNTSYVFVYPQYGFNGSVNLSVSGLPSGVTASFNPTPTTGTSTLTLTASSTAAVGSYTLTITGTSGSLTQTTTLGLGVFAPSFTLNATPSVALGQGSSGTASLYISSQYGFSGNVNLSVSGLPAGVTASFSPNPTNNYSTLTFTASSAASVGSTTLTLTGVSGSETQTTTLTLSIFAPTFSLSGGYSVNMNEGTTTTQTIYVNDQYGFTGAVTLAASGLPSGVTATISPNPTTTSSIMTLTASSNAAQGPANVTITGTSGATTASTSFQLTINTPTFALTAAPTRLSLMPGSSANSIVTLTPANGFSGAVALTASGLPSGVTATFSPSSTSTDSIMTLTAGSSVSPGLSQVTITGTSGSQTSSTAVNLVVLGSAATTSTTLSLTASGTTATSVASGTMITATAAVNAGSTPLTVGQVNFCDATSTTCDLLHQIGSAQLTSAGTAVLHFVPGPGSRSYKAVFAGTNQNTASTSAASSLTVTAAQATTTTMTSSGTVGNYTLTGTVTGKGPFAPSGNLAFLDTSSNNTSLGQPSLVSGAAVHSFSTSQSPNVGSQPGMTVTADFNGDGIPDLAVVNQNSGTISILLGNGDGTFTTGSGSLTPASAPSFMAVGDFNGDGMADLAVLSSYGSNVMLYLGNGDGTFTASTSSPQSDGTANMMVVGDFNGDGIQDLAISSRYNGTITIQLGNGDGTFNPVASIAAGYDESALALADFNGDGVPDLAVTSTYTGIVSILLGNGDGSFTFAGGPAVSQSATAIAVADFNGDGKPDLVVASGSYYSSAVTVLLGNGDGTFTPGNNLALPSNAYVQALAVADFNRDGKADVIVANYNNASVLLYQGNGDGTFGAASTTATGADPSAIAVGDWNGAGIPGVAVANSQSNTLTILTSSLAQTATATMSGVSPLGQGQHAVEASYPGDGSYQSSVSAATNLTGVDGTPTVSVTLSASNITSAQPLTVTVAVSDGAGTPTPTGSVVLTSGNYSSASAKLASGGATIVIPAGSLAGGSDTLHVAYAPDTASASLYNPASGSATVTVLQLGSATPTITVTPSATTITNLQTDVVAVTVAGITGQPTPTGTITLSSGSYSAQQTLSSGAASFTIPAGVLVAGANTLTAAYSGDIAYATTSSNTAVVTLAPVAPSSTPIAAVSPGATASSTVTWSAGSGYAGTLNLSCALSASPTGAQSPPTCSLSVPSVTLTANGKASATLTIATTASSTAALDLRDGLRRRLFGFGGSLSALLVLCFLPGRRRRMPGLLLLLGFFTLTLTLGISGCGGSGGGGSSSPPPTVTPATTAGSYTFTVTATDSASSVKSSTNVTFTVQ